MIAIDLPESVIGEFWIIDVVYGPVGRRDVISMERGYGI
jgi:hypothetical protein